MAFLYIQNNYFIAAFILLGMFASQATSRMLSEALMSEKFEQYIAVHSRVYKNETEKATRFQIFKDNVEFIESFNKGKQTYKLSINEFADRTNKEFQAFRNGYKRESSPKATPFRYGNVTELPSSIDWREQGAVTAVKDQGQCGSCWAFSVIAATEGITKLKTGKLISLSEQELVDCDRSGEDQGCEGGYMEHGFEFIVENGGIASETSYPYTEAEGTCNSEEVASPAAKITGHENVPANSEAALLQAVASQPVSVAIDAGGSAFQHYSSGVFKGECGTDLNHAVTAVGYGETSDGTKYWLVKNSWGTTWGDGGYMMMERDVTAEGGLCGIAMAASYPTA